VLNSILKDAPYYIKYTIRAGAYSGVEKAATVIGVATPLLANKDVTKERVYEVTKLMYEKRAQKHMKSVYAAWDLSPALDAARSMGIPVHPGAEQYFKEAGILK